MTQVDRLLIKAKSIAGLGGQRLDMAMVTEKNGRWEAECHLWDGEQGHTQTVVCSVHDTEDEAIDYVHEQARKYPNSRDLIILVDDI